MDWDSWPGGLGWATSHCVCMLANDVAPFDLLLFPSEQLAFIVHCYSEASETGHQRLTPMFVVALMLTSLFHTLSFFLM